MARDLWAVVADAPLARFDAAAIEGRLRDLDWVTAQAQAHEVVVEAWLDAALVPLRLFTIYASDERAVEALARRSDAIRAAARAAKGCCEWTLRVMLDPARAQAAARERSKTTPPASTPASTDDAGRSAGRAFLARKQRERDAARQASVHAREEAQAAVAALAARARQTLSPAGGPAADRLLAEATFLVPRTKHREFLAAADAACARLTAAGCDARVSGPWPPYQVAGVVAGAGAAS